MHFAALIRRKHIIQFRCFLRIGDHPFRVQLGVPARQDSQDLYTVRAYNLWRALTPYLNYLCDYDSCILCK